MNLRSITGKVHAPHGNSDRYTLCGYWAFEGSGWSNWKRTEAPVTCRSCIARLAPAQPAQEPEEPTPCLPCDMLREIDDGRR